MFMELTASELVGAFREFEFAACRHLEYIKVMIEMQRFTVVVPDTTPVKYERVNEGGTRHCISCETSFLKMAACGRFKLKKYFYLNVKVFIGRGFL